MLRKIMELENDNGTPKYDYVFTVEGIVKVRAIRDKMLQALPEVVQYWKDCQNFYRKHGFIEEPIWKRIRHCGDGPLLNDLANFPAQAGGFAIVAEAMERVIDNLIPFDFKAGTGLVAQTHDSGIWRVKEDDAESLAKPVLGALDGRYLDTDFTWEGSGKNKDGIADRWHELDLAWNDNKDRPGKDADWEESEGMEGFELSWLDRLISEKSILEEATLPTTESDEIPF